MAIYMRTGSTILAALSILILVAAMGAYRAVAQCEGQDPGSLPEIRNPLAANNAFPLAPDLAEPAAGQSFRDPWTDVCITRVTETSRMRHFYSRIDPYNADQTLIVLHDTSGGWYHVFRTDSPPYARPENQVGERFSMDDPRWDPEDPNLLWAVDGFELVILDLATGTRIVVKDFSQDPVVGPVIAAEPDLYRVTVMYEGEPSRDFRWWAFALQGTEQDYRLRHLLCWDRAEDKVVGFRTLSPEESDIDWVGMSPLGTHVVVGAMYDNGGEITGLCIADHELKLFHRVNYGVAHSDVGLDTRGNEVIVMQNTRTDFVDMMPLTTTTLPIMEPGGDYEGTGHIPLARLNYSSSSPDSLASSGLHICCNTPGWCLITPHIQPDAPERNWMDRTIILVRLDPEAPKVYALAKLHHDSLEYWEETQGVMTNDGSRVLWISNWGRDPGSNMVSLMEALVPPALLAP